MTNISLKIKYLNHILQFLLNNKVEHGLDFDLYNSVSDCFRINLRASIINDLGTTIENQLK